MGGARRCDLDEGDCLFAGAKDTSGGEPQGPETGGHRSE